VVALTDFNLPNVIVKFVTTASGAGNNLYIDNINLLVQPNTNVGERAGLSLNTMLFPNPAGDRATALVNAKQSVTGSLTVVNTLGQVVVSKPVQFEAGNNTVMIDTQNLGTGVYQVIVDTKNGSTINKLSISK